MTVVQWLEILRSARHARALATTPASDDEVRRATQLSPHYGEFLRRHGAIRAFPRGRAIGLFVYARPAITTYGGKTCMRLRTRMAPRAIFPRERPPCMA